jgi:hypothetical protein
MTNTGKLLVIGLLVIDAGVAGYLLFPKEDERPRAVTGTVISSATPVTGGDSRTSEPHAVTGGVVRTTPPVGGTDEVAATPRSTAATRAPAPTATTAVAVAPVAPVVPVAPATPVLAAPVAPPAPVAPNTGRPTALAANGPQSATGTVAAAEVQQPAPAKPKPALQADQTHARKHDDPRRNSSNQISAALTAELVKESSKPDPSLPLPPNSGTGNLSDSGPTGGGPNSVASAMTDQLVRESSRVNPSSAQSGISSKR